MTSKHKKGRAADLKIVIMKAGDLIFAEYNPRQLTKDQFQSLKDSLTRFGFAEPIIVNRHPERKNIIIGGHQRVRVAKAIGIDEIPAVFLNLDFEQERELNIRLNKNTGGWNWDELANNFGMEELIEWGFKESELDFGDVPFFDGSSGPDSRSGRVQPKEGIAIVSIGALHTTVPTEFTEDLIKNILDNYDGDEPRDKLERFIYEISESLFCDK